MITGFHTSALAEHDLASAGAVLRRCGFEAAVVRLSLARLDPLAERAVRSAQMGILREGLRGLQSVIDADGRYLVDRWVARPTGLLDEGAEGERHREYLRAAVEVAGELGGGYVTFSVGPRPPGMEVQVALDRLLGTVLRTFEAAAGQGVMLCVRPRMGDFVDSLGHFERLVQWTGGRADVRLAADVGAMVASGEMPVADLLVRLGDRLGCVYLSETRLAAGRECVIGGGHVSAERVVAGLAEHRFEGPVLVEPAESAWVDPEGAAEYYRRVFGGLREQWVTGE